jgi:hypothetical protein
MLHIIYLFFFYPSKINVVFEIIGSKSNNDLS